MIRSNARAASPSASFHTTFSAAIHRPRPSHPNGSHSVSGNGSIGMNDTPARWHSSMSSRCRDRRLASRAIATTASAAAPAQKSHPMVAASAASASRLTRQRSRNRGLSTSSSANPTIVNDSVTIMIATPGGMSHHHQPADIAPAVNDALIV